MVSTERTLARRTTALVAVGQQLRDELVAAGIGRADQFTVVPPGVPLPEAPPRAEARAMFGIPADVPVVAFVARLTAVKRPDRFADVALRLHERLPDAHFVIAGEGELLADLEHRMRPLGDQATILGWRSDVQNVYGAADVAVLVSDNEGMPVSLIEAAACGVPAVTTDVGSASEVVEHDRTGIVVPADVTAVADALETLLRDRDRRAAMGTAAAARARERFSPDRLVTDITELYERILPRR